MLNTKSSEVASLPSSKSQQSISNEGISIADLDSHIHSIEKLVQVRSALPRQLNLFPFNRFKILERGILKLIELLFRDQRKINEALLEAIEFTKNAAQQMVWQVQEAAEQTAQRGKELKREIGHLKSRVSQQHRLINLMLNDEKRLLSKSFNNQQLKEVQCEKKHLLDSFYVALEEKFRGTREDIKNRVKVYLSVIANVNSCSQDFPLVDIGCGRGEWLELLKETGYTARGVDVNKVMVQQCRERGLDVVEFDAIAHLRSLSDASLGAVTGIHIIEHLPFGELIQLLDEIFRVLKPGGVVIFETPNPQNILVGSCNFYMDPTHLKPLPSPMIQFLAEERGFDRVEILNLHPIKENSSQKLEEISDFLFPFFYGAQDYAIIGYK